MVRNIVVVLFSLAFAIVASDSGDCTEEGNTYACKCKADKNYDALVLGPLPGITELTISDCASAELGPGFLALEQPWEKIAFRDIIKLHVLSTFPSELTEFHLDRVGLQKVSADIFSGDTRLKQLKVHNTTIDLIKSDTFENVAVENAHFEHVNFLHLEVDALAFAVNMSDPNKKDHSDIYFRGCRFYDLDDSSISVAPPGKIRFVDNILNCTDLRRTYSWMNDLIGEQTQKDLLCRYLDENFCESKQDDNKLFRRLLESNILSKQIGMQLDKSCPEQYEQYIRSMPMTNPMNAGSPLHANLAISLLGFFVTWLTV